MCADVNTYGVRAEDGLQSGIELVAAALGDEDLRVGRILLDLLTQPVDMGLERVGRNAGIVTPDLFEQRVAGRLIEERPGGIR